MNRNIALSIVLLCCLSMNMGNTAYSQQSWTLPALEQYLSFKLKRDHVPGIVACVIHNDGIVWSKGFGFRNVEHQLPVTMKSVIDVASVTKLVTATAVMQLVERGRINLSDPINKHLPFRILHPIHPDKNITVEHLLTHTASTSNGPSLWRTFSCSPQASTLEEWVRAYFLPGGQFYDKQGNFAEWKPGEKFLYSNAGFTLLAYIVEVASGSPFREYCRKHIFDPLGMHSTSFDVASQREANLSTMYSYGYNMDLERDLMCPGVDCGKVASGDYLFPLCNYTSPTIGAGGLHSSAEDLSKLLIALIHGGVYKNKSVMKTPTVTAMLAPRVDSKLLPGQFASFGLGAYAMRLSNGEPVWGHTGADPGTSTFMLFNPETKVGAIVLANRFVDIRDLIEWLFAESIGYSQRASATRVDRNWEAFAGNRHHHRVTFRAVPNYLPGGSKLHIVGNHRYLGCWVQSGIPLSPQKDRSWEKTISFPDSTRLEFKFTRGLMKTEAVTLDGKVVPNTVLVVERDTVVNMIVEDWKDQAQ